MKGISREKETPDILIVDDESNLLKILGDILQELEVEVVKASDAEAAMAAIESRALDLVITDLKNAG